MTTNKKTIRELGENIGFVSLLWLLLPKTKTSIKTLDGWHLNARRAEYNRNLQIVLDAAKSRLNPEAHGGTGIEYCAALSLAIQNIEALNG